MKTISFRHALLVAVAGLLLTVSRSQAAYDAFLKISGITGESTDPAHTNEIPVLSFSFGMSNPATIGSGGAGGISAGKVSFSDLNIMKTVDAASVPLALACAQGTHFSTVTLTLRDQSGGQVEFYKVKLTEALITSVQTSGSAGGDTRPTESISIAFQKIEWTYQRVSNGQAVGAPVIGSFDQATGTVN